ncbi:uncharacterized protein LOC110914312 [Helianthus annuus]|uniref:uncharacterized protein LOC110914312 n=1 Tax=Helianthus annuus TaxID=4232 RepID=UPI000B90658C|nr:uncharacterized protein LOC110914312 [Helianthus annuus]
MGFFRDRFKEKYGERPSLCCEGFKTLSGADKEFLVEPSSLSEIKEAVNDCGSDKAPGPDGINLKFIKTLLGAIRGSSFITLVPKRNDPVELKNYRPINLIGIISKMVSKVLANRLKKVIGTVISESQTAFVKDLRKKVFFFKIDFEKAFDNVNWNFLISIMVQMGFPSRWCNWIKGVLELASSSGLVNGPPTFEFQCSKGLRQGDRISPFLFILVMEAFSCMIEKARREGAISGIDSAALKDMAATVGCQAGSFPFKYLGLLVGANMNRIVNWKPVINIFYCRLAKWKTSLLSIGGGITLIKSVLECLPNYYFSLYKAPNQVIKILEAKIRGFLWGGDNTMKKLLWVAWDRVTRPKNCGGLRLSKLKSINTSMLAKWGWMFLEDKRRLWVEVIESIHITRNSWDFLLVRKMVSGVWCNIVQVLTKTTVDGVPLRN